MPTSDERIRLVRRYPWVPGLTVALFQAVYWTLFCSVPAPERLGRSGDRGCNHRRRDLRLGNGLHRARPEVARVPASAAVAPVVAFGFPVFVALTADSRDLRV